MARPVFLATICLTLAAGNPPGFAYGQAIREWALEATATTDISSARGGDVGSRLYGRTLSDLRLGVGFGPVLGVGDLFLGADFLALVGRNGSEGLGDVQGFSNIDASPGAGLAELWLQWAPAGTPVRIKVGKADVNADFASVDAAGEFVNSSLGFSPTILGLPTYPDPAVGVGVFLDPVPQVSLNGGVFSGGGPNGRRGDRPGATAFGGEDLFDETFLIVEAGFSWGDDGRAGRASVGGWRHSGEFARGESRTSSGTSGFFATAEQHFGSGLSLFLMHGRADASVSDIEMHAAVGSLWEPFGPGEEAVGASLTIATMATVEAVRELAVEVFYRFRLGEHLAVKPELQYIVNPGGDSTRSSAVVLLLRVESFFAAGRAREER